MLTDDEIEIKRKKRNNFLRILLGMIIILFCTGFMAYYYLWFLMPVSDTKITWALSTQNDLYKELTIGAVFFDGFDHYSYDDNLNNIHNARFVLDNMEVLRDGNNSYLSNDGHNEMVTLLISGKKIVNDLPIASVTGKCYWGVEMPKNLFKNPWDFTSHNRYFSTPSYKCLVMPKSPEDVGYALEDLLNDSQVAITDFIPNEDCNQITVRYNQKESTFFSQSVATKERTLFYQGYSDVWKTEGQDGVIQRDYKMVTLTGAYSCEYNGKALRFEISGNEDGSAEGAHLYYDDNYLNTEHIYDAAKSIKELSQVSLGELSKNCEGNVLSFKDPKCIIRAVLGKGAIEGTVSLMEKEDNIYFIFDKDGAFALLPDINDEERLVRYELKRE